MNDAWKEITVNDREKIIAHFDSNPSEPIRVYVPASGSWCETFHSKDQYLNRQQAHMDLFTYMKGRSDHRFDAEANRLLEKFHKHSGLKSECDWWS